MSDDHNEIALPDGYLIADDADSASQELTVRSAAIPLPEDADGWALILGDIDWLTDLERDSVRPLTGAAKQSTDKLLGTLASTANVAAQVANGLSQSGHLVRLAPETVAALKAGNSFMTHAGKSVGVLTGANHKVTSLAAFTQVSTFPAVAASLTSALTLAAMQAQLNQMQKTLDRIEKTSARIEELIEIDHWAELWSLVQKNIEIAERVRARDSVGETILRETDDIGRQLDAHLRRLIEEARTPLAELPDSSGQSGAIRRLEWLSNGGTHLVGVLEQLVAVHSSMRVCLAVRIWSAAASPEPEDQIEAQVIREQAETAFAKYASLITQLAQELDWSLAVALLAPGSRPLKEWASVPLTVAYKSSTEREDHLARELRAQVKRLVPAIHEPPAIDWSLAQYLGADPSPNDNRWQNLLPYFLNEGEIVQSVIFGMGAGGSNNFLRHDSIVVLTNGRAIGFRKDKFGKTARLEFALDRATLVQAHITDDAYVMMRDRVIRFEWDNHGVDMTITAMSKEDEDRLRIILDDFKQGQSIGQKTIEESPVKRVLAITAGKLSVPFPWERSDAPGEDSKQSREHALRERGSRLAQKVANVRKRP